MIQKHQLTMSDSNKIDYIKARKFVEQLLKEGKEVSCDETNESFAKNDELPEFYDEKLYKKGQKFFKKHFMSMLFAKMHGLLAILSISSIRNILMFTNMSSSDLTAYRRYMATIFHMLIWYDEQFKPGSKLWKSIAYVRNTHNKTSKRACADGLTKITQLDMVLTQFGFLGFALARSNLVGIHKTTEEEWKGFLHVWRVVGYMMGVEDRFNLCTESVAETRQRCNVLIEKIFHPEIENRNEDFLTMCGYLIRGLWTFVPSFTTPSLMNSLHMLIQTNLTTKDINQIPHYFQMNKYQTSMLKLHYYVILNLLVYDVWRVFFNYIYFFSVWLMRTFPFLVYYRFGKENALLKIHI